MPRKRVTKKESEIVSTNETSSTSIEHILSNTTTAVDNTIIKLPLTDEFINRVVSNTDDIKDQSDILPDRTEKVEINMLQEPVAHDPVGIGSCAETLSSCNTTNIKNQLCWWCRHPFNEFICNMPIDFNEHSKNYTVSGNFCDFYCCSAYNVSKNTRSNKLHVINEYINSLAKSYGYCIPISPAPPYELLEIFGGSMTIEHFRNAHKSNDRRYTMNIPPQSYVNPTIEIMNTSYIPKKQSKTSIEKMI